LKHILEEGCEQQREGQYVLPVDVDRFLDQMMDSYVTVEQRSIHNGDDSGNDQPSDLTFF
jgi:DNA-binding ferritin-like protein (Dps family)